MIVKQVWTGNAYRNFNYLIACPESGEALAIDPLDHEKCLGAAKDAGWDITQVLNTHEHGDHIGGNRQVIAATGRRSFAATPCSTPAPATATTAATRTSSTTPSRPSSPSCPTRP